MENVKYKSPEDMPIISGGMGWGKCAAHWCNCSEFKGTGNICERCGHAYTEHY